MTFTHVVKKAGHPVLHRMPDLQDISRGSKATSTNGR
jgi:hypothetical protein